MHLNTFGDLIIKFLLKLEEASPFPRFPVPPQARVFSSFSIAANDAWKVTYDGYVTPQGAEKPYRKITNTSTDSERYFISVISENNLQTGFDNDINKYIKYAIENLTSTSTGWSKYVLTTQRRSTLYYATYSNSTMLNVF